MLTHPHDRIQVANLLQGHTATVDYAAGSGEAMLLGSGVRISEDAVQLDGGRVRQGVREDESPDGRVIGAVRGNGRQLRAERIDEAVHSLETLCKRLELALRHVCRGAL